MNGNKRQAPATTGIEVNASEALARLGLIEKRLYDFRPAFRWIAGDFAKSQGTMFRKRGAISGYEKWADLSPKTIAKKRGKNKRKILQDTGKLYRSLTNTSDSNFAAVYNRKSLEIGTKVPHAKYHMTGTQNMPQRSLFRVAEKRRRSWTSKILRYAVSKKLPKFEGLR